MMKSNFFNSLVTDIRNREGLLDLIEDSSIATVDYLVSKSISYTDIISSGVTLGKVKDIGLRLSHLELFGPIDTTADVVSLDEDKDYVVVKGNSLPFTVRLFVLLRERLGRDIEEYLNTRQDTSEVNWAGYPKSLLPTNLKNNTVQTEISSVMSEFDRGDLLGFFPVISTIQSLLDLVKRAIVVSLNTEEYPIVKSLIYSTCVNVSDYKHIVELSNKTKNSIFSSKDFRVIIEEALSNDFKLNPTLISNVLDTIALRLLNKLSIDILKFDIKDNYGNS